MHFPQSPLLAMAMMLFISFNSCRSKAERQTESSSFPVEEATESIATNGNPLGQDTITEYKSNAIVHSSKNYSKEDHQGTTPDDGTFGYDYWDSPDDRYEMERNQMDAWPDEW